jgi:hypothetical protein
MFSVRSSGCVSMPYSASSSSSSSASSSSSSTPASSSMSPARDRRQHGRREASPDAQGTIWTQPCCRNRFPIIRVCFHAIFGELIFLIIGLVLLLIDTSLVFDENEDEEDEEDEDEDEEEDVVCSPWDLVMHSC